MAGPLTVSEPATDPIPAPMADPGTDPLAADELLVEEVSIDGMCGVY
jgi:mycofactocin precursor